MDVQPDVVPNPGVDGQQRMSDSFGINHRTFGRKFRKWIPGVFGCVASQGT